MAAEIFICNPPLGKNVFNILYLLPKNLVYLLSFFLNAPLNNHREPETLIRWPLTSSQGSLSPSPSLDCYLSLLNHSTSIHIKCPDGSKEGLCRIWWGYIINESPGPVTTYQSSKVPTTQYNGSSLYSTWSPSPSGYFDSHSQAICACTGDKARAYVVC